jgi:hypothetical protein
LSNVKHGGGNIKVWGLLSREGMGPFMYKSIVHHIKLHFTKQKMPRWWIDQQDNEPKHHLAMLWIGGWM